MLYNLQVRKLADNSGRPSHIICWKCLYYLWNMPILFLSFHKISQNHCHVLWMPLHAECSHFMWLTHYILWFSVILIVMNVPSWWCLKLQLQEDHFCFLAFEMQRELQRELEQAESGLRSSRRDFPSSHSRYGFFSSLSNRWLILFFSFFLIFSPIWLSIHS